MPSSPYHVLIKSPSLHFQTSTPEKLTIEHKKMFLMVKPAFFPVKPPFFLVKPAFLCICPIVFPLFSEMFGAFSALGLRAPACARASWAPASKEPRSTQRQKQLKGPNLWKWGIHGIFVDVQPMGIHGMMVTEKKNVYGCFSCFFMVCWCFVGELILLSDCRGIFHYMDS